ncbi:Thiosulfate sulfurtransferase, rhodanese [plant metagenome]|uniref:Thiosulfate sulfurtransferase, rhodanese n=1 Tax=plant metagenome TaxID=1297885 RepID=A0A484RH03_9ZZZZ
MPYTTLIQPDELQSLLQADPAAVLVCDCSFDLTDPQAGRRTHDAAHVPGAVYVSLDDVLSTAKTGRNGRHPLPTVEEFAARMAALGLAPGMQVVGYDNAGGMYAARLWWMLRWAGHEAVAVLDGGLAAWRDAGFPASDLATPARAAGRYAPAPSLVNRVDYDTLRGYVEAGDRLVIDARAADRFRGENETLDPVGGHIPGARNRFFKDNLTDQGRFKSPAALRDEFAAVLGDTAPARVVAQCGSGVTACHNLLAMEVAGLGGATLYPGSWSEWSTQPGAPVATGTA